MEQEVVYVSLVLDEVEDGECVVGLQVSYGEDGFDGFEYASCGGEDLTAFIIPLE